MHLFAQHTEPMKPYMSPGEQGSYLEKEYRQMKNVLFETFTDYIYRLPFCHLFHVDSTSFSHRTLQRWDLLVET